MIFDLLINPFTGLMVLIGLVTGLAARSGPSPAGWLAISLYFASFMLANLWRSAEERELALQLYQLGAFLVIVLYVGTIWLMVRWPNGLRDGDVAAQLYWTVLLFAELGQVFEYLGCKILYDPYTENELAFLWRTAVDASSCGRAFGSFAPYVLPLITTGFMAWPALRAYQVWKAETRASGGSSSRR